MKSYFHRQFVLMTCSEQLVKSEATVTSQQEQLRQMRYFPVLVLSLIILHSTRFYVFPTIIINSISLNMYYIAGTELSESRLRR